MCFDGGAELSPLVTVARHVEPGSMTNGDVNFRIKQGERIVFLSPETMKDILEWYGEET